MKAIKQNQNSLIELSGDLRSFGLNPSQWRILRDNSRVYRVQSKLDQNFIFIGKAQRRNSRFKWQKLELVSI